uniref:Uncharacterized protein n=1 Tax=Panagrolaimus davidi TaxID=227884 RepID=A0A914QHF5_9BILA
MVFHVGIAPLCGEMAVFNTTNLRTKIYDFREVGKNNVELIEGMYKRIKSIAKGELGYAGICLGSSYGNEIRQKFIKHGLECGFKNIEIIDWETQMYLNAISQSGYQPKNGDTICVLNGKLCHFWEKSNEKSEYRGSANGIFNDKTEIDKMDFIKDPNVIIYLMMMFNIEKHAFGIRKVALHVLNEPVNLIFPKDKSTAQLLSDMRLLSPSGNEKCQDTTNTLKFTLLFDDRNHIRGEIKAIMLPNFRMIMLLE